MAKDKTQLSRLLFIDRKIQEGMRSGLLANCSSMAAEYEVSAKSILRDIDYLRNQRDAPIAYDAARRGYFYTEASYSLPAISLRERDLFALCIAEKALRMHEGTPIYQALRNVFRKIEASLPDKVSVQPLWVERRLSVVADPQTRVCPEIWDAVASGLHASKSLLLSYRKPGAAGEVERRVDPYHLARYQGEWYLIGHCHLRGRILTFAMSRVAKIVLCPETFTVPDTFDPAHYVGGQFGIFGGEGEPVAVRLRFAREHAPYVLEREWHPEQTLSACDDGGVELGFPVLHLQEVKRWVLSWGRGVRVLAPVRLAEEVRHELAAALAEHSSPPLC